MPEEITKKLVDEFDQLDKLQKETEEKISNIKSEIINIAQLENKEIIFGTNKKCSIKPFSKVIYSEDKTKITAIIKNKGLYDHFSHLNYPRLSAAIIKNDVDKEIIDEIKVIKDFRVSLIDRGI